MARSCERSTRARVGGSVEPQEPAQDGVYYGVESPSPSSLRSIQILVERGPEVQCATTQATTTSASDLPRWKCHRRSRISALCYSLLSAVWTLGVVVTPPTVLALLLHFSEQYVLVTICSVFVAFGAAEIVWSSHRLRSHLLQPFQEEQPTAVSLRRRDDLQQQEMPSQDETTDSDFAIARIVRRYRGGCSYVAAGVLAAVASSAIVLVVVAVGDSMIKERASAPSAWRVVLFTVGLGSFSAFFCAALTPTPSDAVVLLVFQIVFIVAGLNSFLANYEHLVDEPELLDPLYVLLVGFCAIIVWRIVSSERVLDTLCMAMLDTAGLVYLVAPLMAYVDILSDPHIHHHRFKIITFFVVVAAGDLGQRLYASLKVLCPSAMLSCRHSVSKQAHPSMEWEAVALSLALGAAAFAVITTAVVPDAKLSAVDAVIFAAVVCITQVCRLALDTFRAVASEARGHPVWVPRLLRGINSYLLAGIVFHPYVKSLNAGHEH
ncbi:hypothetical protein P43SY_004835 [Pythium insidiosum]|uniref:Transmembrane protein n=1 Tax=Pythium insidiosum TaxID=114742 RepID=A0AAD5LJV5_PYTIN|nr:hypothetical protein P43SY_004835 [Pythium insidiosum]